MAPINLCRPAGSVGVVLTTDARGRRGFGGGLVLVLAAVGLAAVFLLLANLFGMFGFGERTIDRSQPPLLVSLTDLAEYRAALEGLESLVRAEDWPALRQQLALAQTLRPPFLEPPSPQP